MNRRLVAIGYILVFLFGSPSRLVHAEPIHEPGVYPAGTTLYTLNLTTLSLKALPKGAAIVNEGPAGQSCLRVTVTRDADKTEAETSMLTLPIDLSPWRGMQVMLLARVRAEGVTEPAQSYNGVKVQVHYESPSRGPQWPGVANVFGTFPWQEVSALVSVGSDVTSGQLQLGLQGSSGTVWITDVRIVAWRQKLKRPVPVANAPAPNRGHNLPRLRGVVSPNAFRVEDFDMLAKWNVNVIRWQMTRDWGKAGTDTDLAEYDQWLNGKLDDLAKALDAAAVRGIKVVVDVHSPPGGRLEDRSMRMFYEKPYADHFVAVWERIAKRFKGHPAIWGYDLVNEPVQNRPSPPGLLDWYGLQVRAAKAVRAIDADTTIIFEVDQWDAPSVFDFLQPVDIPRVVYQVHMYQPSGFTHQGVFGAWGEASGKVGIAYPGPISGTQYDKEMLRKELAPVREFQLAYNVPIYVGEFSAIRWAPGAALYLKDCISIFEEYGWDWTYHAFREWGGWSVEHANLPYDRANHPTATEPTDRYLVLKKWFDQNQRTPIPAAKK